MGDDDVVDYSRLYAEQERDIKSYVAEAKHYYDESLVVLENINSSKCDWQNSHIRAQEYIGWLVAYVEELEEKVSDLISDRDYNSL